MSNVASNFVVIVASDVAVVVVTVDAVLMCVCVSLLLYLSLFFNVVVDVVNAIVFASVSKELKQFFKLRVPLITKS